MELNLVLVLVGGTLVVLALLSTVLRRVYLSSVLVALVVGVVVGPAGLDVVDPTAMSGERRWLEEAARITIAIALMSAGLQVNRADLRENLGRSVRLLTVGMLGMWLLTGLGAWLLLDLPVWAGFLVGAVLTPTDPVVASTLVTGRMAEENLPRRLRRTLQLESGANDGLALPLVVLCALMLVEEPGKALTRWAAESALDVGLAVALGLALGYAAGKALERALHVAAVERTSFLGFSLALVLATLGLVHLLGGSGVLAAFLAALAFSAVVEEHVREELEQVQDAVTKFFLLPVFVFFGAVLPWAAWRGLGVAGLAFALWVLFLRRLPVVPLALAGSATSRSETTFLAWFGPIGVAGIFYATHVERFPIEQKEAIFATASLAICASIVVHSLTATPGVRLFAGRSPLTPLLHPLRPGVEAER